MKSLVIYATRSGNTRRVAEAVAAELSRRGEAAVVPVQEASTSLATALDLIVVGGPTEGHAATPDIAAFFDRLAAGVLSGCRAAAFDTRVNWPRWLSGSAASGIGDRLRRAGARLVVPPESFIVSRAPALEPGELERAAGWARALAEAVEPELRIVRPESTAEVAEVR
ncbi:MAG TPA: flavodoxin family protein [Candidatus Limnocylindrales bacterium]|nr:flavodoxin family protein [Candidatus Limnocylindrales bacterium]